jgi:hypothetical protein
LVYLNTGVFAPRVTIDIRQCFLNDSEHRCL